MSEYFAIDLDLDGWDPWLADLEQAPEALEKHMRAALQGSLDLLQYWIASETPVNRGILRGSFQTEITGSARDLTGIVATDLVYGWPVERGRAPGKMPPVGPIAYWLYRKKIVTDRSELRSVAYAVAKAIGKRGTKGAAMVYQAWARAARGQEIGKIWQYELDAFLKDLAGA